MILGIPKKMLTIVVVIVGVVVIYLSSTNKLSAGAASSPTGCKIAVTADVLNARSAPQPNAGIVGKYVKDAQVDAQPVVQNGFRKIADTKWISAEFAKPMDGSHCG